MTKVLIIDNDIDICIAFHDYLINLNDKIIVDYESCWSELSYDEYNLYDDEYDIIICNFIYYNFDYDNSCKEHSFLS